MPDPEDSPTPIELEALAADTARAAADLVAEGGRAGLGAERLIRELLAAATPQAAFLDAAGAATAPSARLQWVLDPLDGTVNLERGIPLSAIGIAAAVDGQIVAGAVVDVSRAERFSAHLGGTARRDGRPIRVSACGRLADAVVATGFSEQAVLRERQWEAAARVLARAREVRCLGSPALTLCWLAAGRLDGCFEHGVQAHGASAAALIAEEAGARTELPCPENHELLIAAAPGVFDALRAAVELPALRSSA